MIYKKCNTSINTAAELMAYDNVCIPTVPLYVIHRAEQHVIHSMGTQDGDAASVYTAIAKMILNKMAWAHHPHDEA